VTPSHTPLPPIPPVPLSASLLRPVSAAAIPCEHRREKAMPVMDLTPYIISKEAQAHPRTRSQKRKLAHLVARVSSSESEDSRRGATLCRTLLPFALPACRRMYIRAYIYNMCVSMGGCAWWVGAWATAGCAAVETPAGRLGTSAINCVHVAAPLSLSLSLSLSHTHTHTHTHTHKPPM